jgi:hypothetical protein
VQYEYFLLSIFMGFPVVEAERHVSRLAVPDPAHASRAGAHSPVFCQVYRPEGSFPCKMGNIVHVGPVIQQWTHLTILLI